LNCTVSELKQGVLGYFDHWFFGHFRLYTTRVAKKEVSKSKHLKLFASFAFFGLFAAGVDLCIYGILIWIGMNPLVSNLISSSIGILLNYVLVSSFTFDVDYRNMRNFFVFFGVAIVVLFLSSIFLSTLINQLRVNPFLAKLLTLPISAVTKYVLNRKYTFTST
jgi:putative flippase GtrA